MSFQRMMGNRFFYFFYIIWSLCCSLEVISFRSLSRTPYTTDRVFRPMRPFRLKPLFLGGYKDSFWRELREYYKDDELEEGGVKLSPEELILSQQIEFKRKYEWEDEDKKAKLMNSLDEYPGIATDLDVLEGTDEFKEGIGYDEKGQYSDEYICSLPSFKLRHMLFRAGMTDTDCYCREDLMLKARSALAMIDNGTARPSREPPQSAEEVEADLIYAESVNRLFRPRYEVDYNNLKIPEPTKDWANNTVHSTNFGEVLPVSERHKVKRREVYQDEGDDEYGEEDDEDFVNNPYKPISYRDAKGRRCF